MSQRSDPVDIGGIYIVLQAFRKYRNYRCIKYLITMSYAIYMFMEDKKNQTVVTAESNPNAYCLPILVPHLQMPICMKMVLTIHEH